ncbi:hydroxy-delta-5-steroid dehydrogenase, 3 beta- and steroid delta-isomerase 1 [Narcine bancroftii]|uniref:hydroxy-delta-5-steroid dehydrogenase, 3 beta- and steroid delta-isomerase 1 n=1 Tax=Narcine bancroftii TaxID=1343680 RepID=UPI003832099E
MSGSGDVYLVTGGCGFLGKVIIKLLIEKACDVSEVRMFDKVIQDDYKERLQALVGSRIKLIVIKGDVRNKEDVQKACQGVTHVIHTASLIDVWGHFSNEEIESVNIEGSRLLLETCIQHNVKYFIYTSSMEAMGPNSRGDPICNGDEDTIYTHKPIFLYSRSKLAAEQLILRANGSPLPNGGQIVSSAMRPTYIYGENSVFLKEYLHDAIANGNVLVRTSKKQAHVNPVYVENVAWGHILLARAMKEGKGKIVGGKFYFMTDDTPHMSYSDFNEEIMSCLGITMSPNLSRPLMLMYFIAYLKELLQFLLRPFIKYTPKINRGIITLNNTKFTLTSHKAQNDFDYIPLYSWEVAKGKTIAWLASLVQKPNSQ